MIGEEWEAEKLREQHALKTRDSGEGGKIPKSSKLLMKMPDPALQEVDRVTLNVTLYHQSCCNDPMAAHCNFSELLQTTESPYKRPMKNIGGSWKPLDLGWLGTQDNLAGILMIENLASLKLRVQMTDEQKAELAKMVLLVKHQDAPDKAAIRLKPKNCTVGEFVNPREWIIKSEHGLVDAMIYAIPR